MGVRDVGASDCFLPAVVPEIRGVGQRVIENEEEQCSMILFLNVYVCV